MFVEISLVISDDKNSIKVKSLALTPIIYFILKYFY